jgi:serine/threonine protein kinase
MSELTSEQLRVSGETTLPVGDAAAPGAGPSDLERGATLGRYIVLGTLGAGGMGVVYSAYDPELDRKVAVKLLHASAHDSIGRARLLREAQALARLSHPNIVSVYDVGTHGDRVWVAMELVAGTTLGRWLRGRPREWPAVLETMIAAGRGLAAAHATGLVHRDFKPDNVMVGDDGRVRVMDFGLARAAASDAAHELAGDDDLAPRLPALRDAITRAGSIAGTPAYMAPEQFAAASVDARTDQFSFCVAAWEALFGRRPFRGESALELGAAVMRGAIEPAPAGRRVPSWLRKLLIRGLAPAPEERWPTMDALLHALARGRARARSRRLVVSLAFAGVLGMGAFAVHRVDLRTRTAACEREGFSISGCGTTERARGCATR